MQATYISPLTDFGFKKIFGEEPNKDLLISFLNTLLPEHHQVADLQYASQHSANIPNVPSPFTEEVFHRLFAIAELAKFDPKDRQRYEDSLKYLRDLRNSEATARREGGHDEKLKIARNLLDILDDETIALKTGLDLNTVKMLRES